MNMNEFMKALTQETGLYGQDLYEEVLRQVRHKEKKVQEEKSVSEPLKGGEEFFGSLSELCDYFILRGGSEERAKFLRACSPDFAASIIAGELNMDWFCWKKSIRLLDGRLANRCYVAAFNPASGKWDKFSDCAEEDWKKFLDNNRKLLSLNFH